LGIAGYERITGGDGFVVQFDDVNPSVLYTESQFGNINRLDDVVFSSTGIRPPEAGAERRNWNTPFVTIPDQEGGIIYGAERVYYSGDFGDNWTAISEDLTKGEFGSMSTMDVSAVNQNIMIAGTDDGNVHITTDLGFNWTDISEGLPEVAVSSVVTDPLVESTVYVTFSGYRFNDYLPHVFRSTDYGATWEDISANLPEIPNPVIDILRISTDQNINPIRLEVINLNGQPLLSSSDRESIDVSSLAAGNYILRIVTNKAIEIERFTKI